jgi:hypothetical protein
VHQNCCDHKYFKHYYPQGGVLVAFGSVPFLILISPSTRQSQRKFLQASIKTQGDSVVETGILENHLINFELDEVVRIAVIQY